MHSLHEALVNGFFLGYCCMSYDFEESSNSIVKGNNRQMMVEHTARKVHLYDFVRAGSELHKAKALCVQKHKNVTESIHEDLTTGNQYPWHEPCALPMENKVFTNFDVQAAAHGAGTSEILFGHC